MREVDQRAIGDGRPGPIAQMLQERYAAVVRGQDPGHLGWLTYVG